nr:MAG: putative polyprotein [Hangzhou dicistro-like virus 3]
MIQELKQVTITPKLNKFDVNDYIVNGSLKIDKFIFDIRKLNKGEQHKYCRQLVVALNDKWMSTFYHNSNNDCRALIKLFEKLNIESAIKSMSKFEKKLKFYYKALGDDKTINQYLQQYEDQMFSLFSDMRNVTNNVQQKLDHFDQNYPDFMNKMGQVMDKCDLITAKVLSLFNTFEQTSNFMGVFIDLMKFVSFGYLIGQDCNHTPSNISALIALILPTGIGKSELLPILTRAVLGIIRYFQRNNQIAEHGYGAIGEENVYGIGEALFKTISTCFRACFTTIDEKTYQSMRSSTYFLKTIADLIRSCTTITDFLIRSISKTVDYLMEKIMEHYGMLPFFLKDEQFVKVIDEFLRLKQSDAFQNCGEDLSSAREVIKLRTEVIEMEAHMNKAMIKDKTLIYRVAPFIRIMVQALDKAYDDIPPQFKDNCNAHRIKPFFVMISGEPRIGKSKIFQPLLVNELALRLKIIESYQDPQHYCCFRTAGREFWDGGQGKKVIWYNDLFQGIMNENALDLALEEIGAVVDDNPYHMNMSDVKDKSRYYLTAKLVVANVQEDTTSAGFLNSRLWSHGKHLNMRRDINCKLILNAQWKLPDGKMDHKKIAQFVLDHPEDCYGTQQCKLFPKNMYIVRFLDVQSGNVLSEMPFGEAINYICDVAQSYFARQDILTNNLRKVMETRWEDQMYSQGDDSFETPIATPRFNSTTDLRDEDVFSTMGVVVTQDQIQKWFNFLLASAMPENLPEEDQKELELFARVLRNATGAKKKVLGRMLCKSFNNLGISLIYAKSYKDVNTTMFEIFPYLLFILQSVFHEGKNIEFHSIEHMLHYGIKHETTGYRAFINHIYHQKGTLLEKIWGDPSKMVKSFYSAYQIYEVTETIEKGRPKDVVSKWCRMFREYAIQSINEDIQIVKNILQKIPGWAYFTTGATILGMSSYMLYKYFVSDSPEPQSHEGNAKAKRRRIVRKLGKKKVQTHIEEQSYDNTNKEIERIIRQSYAFLTFETRVNENTWVAIPLSGMALNVKSNIFVMPYHYWYRFEYCNNLYAEHGYPSRVAFQWSTKEKTVAYFDMFEICHLDYGHNADLVYFRIKKFNCGRDLTKYFVSEKDDPLLVDCYLFGYRPRQICDFSTTEILKVGKVTTISKTYQTAPINEHIVGTTIPSETIEYDYCYYYNDCLTGPGDCTMVFMHTDNHFSGKIMGVHTAGNVNHHTGISAPIYREDIEEVTAFFDSDEEPVVSLEIDHIYCDYVSPISEKAIPYIAEGFNVVGNTNVIELNGRQRKITASVPSENKVQPSVVHDIMNRDFGPTKVMPSALARGVDDNGNVVSPFFKAFKKLNNFTNPITQKLHDDIVEHCSQTILSWPSQWNQQNARKLTYDEAINGYMNLKGLDMTTSSGFPFTMINTSKKYWFNKKNEKWYMQPELQKIVENFDEKLKKGIIPPILFVDTLKDELRPISKVKDFKTRMFQVGNLVWTILFRVYYGWFMGHCQSTYECGEMALGINGNSYDWDLLARRIIAMAGSPEEDANDNGDYSDYDSTLCHQACMGLVDAANAFYNAGGIDVIGNRVRHALMLGSINTFHLVHDFIVMRRQGNPSGFLLTTIINNWCNMYYNRYAFVRLTGLSLSEYNKLILGIFYGDDKNATVHHTIRDKFNMLSYQKIMAELGLKYTSATKGDITKPLLSINEISFLKRQFWFDDKMKIWRSRLDHDTIMEIARWSESDPHNMADQLNRFNSTLLELANYSEQEFNFVRNKFVGYIQELQQLNFNIKADQLFTYHYCMHIMYPKHFPSATPPYDLAVIDRERIAVLHNVGGERNLGKLLNYSRSFDDEHTMTEQCFIAQNQVSTQQNVVRQQPIQLTRAEMHVIKRRVNKCLRSSAIRLRPSAYKLYDEVCGVVNESCPCIAMSQFYEIVREIISSKDFWNMTLETIEEEKPQGIDDEAPVENTVSNEPLSTFVETNTTHDAPKLPNDIVTAHKMFVTPTMDNFFERPHLIQTFTWTSTQALGAVAIPEIEFPYALMSIPAVKSKLNNIAWFAPDIEITIRANTTVFHYGGIVFYWMPQAKFLSSGLKSMQAGFNSKFWVQLLANSRQPIRFVVPYTHYKNQLTLGQEIIGTAPTREDLFTLYSYISWPLMSAQTGTVAPVNVSIYARFINTRTNGFTYEVFTPQGIDDEPTSKFSRMMRRYQSRYEGTSAENSWNQMRVIWGQVEEQQQSNSPEQPEEEIVDDDSEPDSEPDLSQNHLDYLSRVERRQLKYVRDTTPKPQRSEFDKLKTTPGYRDYYYRNIKKTKIGKRVYPQGGDGEAQSNTKSGLISDTILRVADFAGKFTPIPYLGAIAAPISAITATAGYFAKWMGFGVAQNLANTAPMQLRMPLNVKAEDCPSSIMLCPNNGLVAKQFSYCNSFPDEMSMDYFIGSPGLIFTGQVLPTNAPGDILFQRAISPREMIYGDYTTPNPATINSYTYWPTYMHIASSYASMWRGGMQFDINFFSTQFHSLRIAVIYQPYNSTSSQVNPTLANYTDAENITFDVQSGETYSVVVPYCQRTEFLSLSNNLRVGPKTKNLTENNGIITVMLINELTSVISTPNQIGFQIFVKPLSDFQFVGYKPRADNVWGINPQGIDDVEVCDYPASSIGCLSSKKPYTFKNGNSNYKVSDIHHAFEITSIRQLMNMMTPIAASMGGNVSRVNIWNIPTMLLWAYNNTNVRTNNFYNLMPLYRYARGGMRISVVTDDSDSRGFGQLELQCDTTTPIITTAGGFAGASVVGDVNLFAATASPGYYYATSASRSPLDIIVPYFNKYKCYLVPPYSSLSNAPLRGQNIPQNDFASAALYFTVAPNNSYTINVGAADDWICGWLLPCHHAKVSAASAEGLADGPPDYGVILEEQAAAAVPLTINQLSAAMDKCQTLPGVSLAHPNDVNKYISCGYGGKSEILSCPPEFHFDTKTLSCVKNTTAHVSSDTKVEKTKRSVEEIDSSDEEFNRIMNSIT